MGRKIKIGPRRKYTQKKKIDEKKWRKQLVNDRQLGQPSECQMLVEYPVSEVHLDSFHDNNLHPDKSPAKTHIHSEQIPVEEILHDSQDCSFREIPSLHDTLPSVSDSITEEEDSDGVLVQEFYVVLDHVYRYEPHVNLDDFVKEKYAEQYQFLKNECMKKLDEYMNFEMIKKSKFIRYVELYDTDKPTVKTCITIKNNFLVEIVVHGVKLLDSHVLWQKHQLSPKITRMDQLEKLLKIISNYKICIGNPEPQYQQNLPKGYYHDHPTTTSAGYLEGDIGANCEDFKYNSTIRSSKCTFLSDAWRCKDCLVYRRTLRKKVIRLQNNVPTQEKNWLTSHKGNTVMSESEKIIKLKQMTAQSIKLKAKIKNLEKRLYYSQLGMRNSQICIDSCPMQENTVNINSNHDNISLQRSSPCPTEDVSLKINPCNCADKDVINHNHGNESLHGRSSVSRETVSPYNSKGDMNNFIVQTESDDNTVTVKVEYELPDDTESERINDISTSSLSNNEEHIKQHKDTSPLNNKTYSNFSQTNNEFKDVFQQIGDPDIDMFDIKRVKIEPLSPTPDYNQSDSKAEGDQCNNQQQPDSDSDQCKDQPALMISETFSLNQVKDNTLLNNFSNETTKCSDDDDDEKQPSKLINGQGTSNQTLLNKLKGHIKSKGKVKVVTLAAFVPVNQDQNKGKYRQIVPRVVVPSSGESVSDNNTVPVLTLPIKRLSNGTDSYSPPRKSSKRNTIENVEKSAVLKINGPPTKKLDKSPNKTDKPVCSIDKNNTNGIAKQHKPCKRGRPRGPKQKFMMDSFKHNKIISPKCDKYQKPYSAVITSVTTTNISSPFITVAPTSSQPVTMTTTSYHPVTMSHTSCKPIAIHPAKNKPQTITPVKSEGINSNTSTVVPAVNLQINSNTYTCGSSIATTPVVGNIVLPPVQSHIGRSNCFILGQPAMSVNPVLQPVTNYVQTQNLVPQPYNTSQMPMAFQFMQNNSNTITSSVSSSPMCAGSAMLVQSQPVLAGNQNLTKFNEHAPMPQPVQLFKNQGTSKQTTNSQRLLLPKSNAHSDEKQMTIKENYILILPKQNPPVKKGSQSKSVGSDQIKNK